MPDKRFERIVKEIRTRIESGQLQPGDRIPSARAITREWGVAVATATRALAALRQEGLVTARPGFGTVVTERSARRRLERDALDREITAEAILATATRIADGDGLVAVSMRRIAIELGVPTMALYRHVRGKNRLLLLMADSIMAQPPLPGTRPAGWRAQLELVARTQWEMYRGHPWMARIISMTRPNLSPHGIAHTEWALSAVDGHGLDPNTMLHLVVTLFGYVRGCAMNVEMQAEAEQESGLTDQEWIESEGTNFARFLASGRYPKLLYVTEASGVDLDADSLFEFGLRRLLDGYAAFLQAT